MKLTFTTYDSALHAALVQSWLDENAKRSTGMDNWDEDVRYWQKESPDSFRCMLVHTEGPCAAVYYFQNDTEVHIGEILVSPESRGKGIGSAVLRKLLYETALCSKATAVIYPDNLPSQKAFRKAGFRHTSTHPDGDAAYYTFHKMNTTVSEIGKLSAEQYGDPAPYRFVVIFARYRNKWLYARHRERITWETAGGHIEPGETPLEAAKRELWEETGAETFTIRPVFDYHADNRNAKPGDHAAGQVFLAEIETLGPIPESEMVETALWDTHPPVEELTYPAILPVLFAKIRHFHTPEEYGMFLAR